MMRERLLKDEYNYLISGRSYGELWLLCGWLFVYTFLSSYTIFRLHNLYGTYEKSAGGLQNKQTKNELNKPNRGSPDHRILFSTK